VLEKAKSDEEIDIDKRTSKIKSLVDLDNILM